MVEKKVHSIEITLGYIYMKREGKTLIIMCEGNWNKYKNVDSAPLENFKNGDYIFIGKMIGKGFEQINYVKMDESEIKKYFPYARKEPKDLFSKFAGTSLFPDKK